MGPKNFGEKNSGSKNFWSKNQLGARFSAQLIFQDKADKDKCHQDKG